LGDKEGVMDMPAWAWILIAVVVVLVAAAAAWAAYGQRRKGLRDRFGPEYDRTVAERGGRMKAESELAARQKRREKLDIRPLDPASRQRYQSQWQSAQARFVDEPAGAVGEADRLVISVLKDRGYPMDDMDDFDQRSRDISVDHAAVVDDYRAAHGISMADDHGKASTEDLRQAMVHYRRLFENLLETRGDQRSAEVG